MGIGSRITVSVHDKKASSFSLKGSFSKKKIVQNTRKIESNTFSTLKL